MRQRRRTAPNVLGSTRERLFWQAFRGPASSVCLVRPLNEERIRTGTAQVSRRGEHDGALQKVMSIFKRIGKLSEPNLSLSSGAAKTDKTVERTLGRKIIRRIAVNMKPYGYVLSKPTFLCREEPLLISFFHFHKYSFGPYFRIHFGVRVLNDDRESPALNGPQFSNMEFEYEAGEADVERCVDTRMAFLVSKGLPWHKSCSDVGALLSEIEDPMKPLIKDAVSLKRYLSASERLRLLEAHDGQSSAENVARSRLLLEIKPAQPVP